MVCRLVVYYSGQVLQVKKKKNLFVGRSKERLAAYSSTLATNHQKDLILNYLYTKSNCFGYVRLEPTWCGYHQSFFLGSWDILPGKNMSCPNFRVVGVGPKNPSGQTLVETPIFRSSLVPSAAALFPKMYIFLGTNLQPWTSLHPIVVAWQRGAGTRKFRISRFDAWSITAFERSNGWLSRWSAWVLEDIPFRCSMGLAYLPTFQENYNTPI